MKSKTTNNRALIGAVTLVVGIMIALGWSFAPSSVGTTQVNAAGQEGGATNEMLAYALNFKSASRLAVFGGESVTDRGSSDIRGIVGSTGEVSGISNISSEDFTTARRDLADTFSYVDQLPCSRVDDTNLGGRTFGPGVYCLGSANLAGRMTVDAGGDINARFVFRVDGTFNADDASSIVREGGAVATNVYIFARGAATIGGNATIGANVISREDVTVGNDSTVSGKVLSVDGGVSTNANIVAAGTGYIEICKQLAEFDRTPVGTLFTFTVTGAVLPGQSTVQVPAGPWNSPNCSPPIQVATANQTVTETIPMNTAVVSITATPNRIVGTPNLAQGSVVIGVVDGDVNNQTVVTYTNQTTRTGTIEICKFAAGPYLANTAPNNGPIPVLADPDVTGFFNFTVLGAPGQTFSVPVGYCSGPITVTILQVNGGPSPSPTQAFQTVVTELAQPTFRLESVTTFPSGAYVSLALDAGYHADGTAFPACPGTTSNPCNQNGGAATINLNIAGGPANQTTVRFFNRSLPGRIKVCKITADPVNIPVGTTFRYILSGTRWNVNPAVPLPNPTPGALPLMGQTETLDVLAGPAGQGGFCTFSTNLWTVGMPVFVGELGIPTAGATQGAQLPAPFNTTFLPLDCPTTNPATGACAPFGPGGGPGYTDSILKVSSITTVPTPGFVTLPAVIFGNSNGFNGTTGTTLAASSSSVPNANPNIFGRAGALTNPNIAVQTTVAGNQYVGWGAINGRNTTAEIAFTNFVYRPAILKLCKIAGAGVTVGTPFTFTIAPVDATTTWPYPSATITVQAGTCVFVNGPFPADGSFPGVGLFNFGTSIRVTEGAAAGTTITGVSSPTLTPIAGTTPPNGPNFTGTLTPDLANRRATLTFNNILGLPYQNPTNYYFNELAFTNAAAVAPPPARAARYDFDGDSRSDVAIFRPSTGTWYYSPSSVGGSRSVQFGQAGDVPVAADYDGDGITDPAVYRSGTWYVLGSSRGFFAGQFGIATDIPQVGDYDGDGKADFAVYRPSDGIWYMMGSTNGFSAVQFGVSTDRPVAADFDGDGRTDPAVYRDGTWYILGSNAGFSAMQFGIAGDIPVQADYDGDGRADAAVYRSGTWYMMGSASGFRAVQFGIATDTPVPADYDGDGKTDVGVYRSSNSVWYILNSSQANNAQGGFNSMQFGAAGDSLLRY